MRYASILGILPTLLACYAADAPVAPKARPDEDTAQAKSASRVEETLYDPDPKHPWNRLHRFLHCRTMQGVGNTSWQPMTNSRRRLIAEGVCARIAMLSGGKA